MRRLNPAFPNLSQISVLQTECINKYLCLKHYWEHKGSCSYTHTNTRWFRYSAVSCAADYLGICTVHKKNPHAVQHKYPTEAGTVWSNILFIQELIYLNFSWLETLQSHCEGTYCSCIKHWFVTSHPMG